MGANAAYEDEETPRRLGRYELIRRVAVGGMAEIFLARAGGLEGFEKLVVLKKILPQYAATPEFVAMFLDEARLVAGLSHPNIASVHDIGLDDEGSYFFAMEFVDGEDVRQILRAAARKGKHHLPVDLAISITLGIAAGLHAAHERRGPDGKLVGIVHRDVSPSNVLVTYDGCVKLIDFGIAKSEGRRAVTRTGVLKGKSSYMSPEQTQGSQLDRRSDVFAIGILLYEITCGRRPFKGDNEYATMRDIVNKTPEPPTSLVKGYPKELEAIVLKCLEKDPGKRYQTALQVQVALERYAQVAQLQVSSVTLAETMRELFADKLSPPPVVDPGKSVQLQRVLRSLTQSEREAQAAREASAGPGTASGRGSSERAGSHRPGSEPREAREAPRSTTVTLPGASQAAAMPRGPEASGSDGSALDAAVSAAAGKSGRTASSAPLTLNSVNIQLPRQPSLFSVAEELNDTPTVLIEKRPLEPMVTARPARRVGVGKAITTAGLLGLLIVAGAAVAGYQSSSTAAPGAGPAVAAPPRAAVPARYRVGATESALPAPRVPQQISQDVGVLMPVAGAEEEDAAAKEAKERRRKRRLAREEAEAAALAEGSSAGEGASAADREAAARTLLKNGGGASAAKPAATGEKSAPAPAVAPAAAPSAPSAPAAAPAPAPAPAAATEKPAAPSANVKSGPADGSP